MKLPEIYATIHELKRYSDRELKRPAPNGRYLRSTIIPKATRAEIRQAVRIAAPKTTRVQRSEFINIDFLVTEQTQLFRESLLYAAQHFVHHQVKGDALPTLVHLNRGRYFVWDGNHRATIALMARVAPRLRALVIRPANRKKRLRSR